MRRPPILRGSEAVFVHELPAIPCLPAGYLVEGYASWRSQRPSVDAEACTGCLLCYLFCPEGSIERVAGGVAVDSEFCKGCGVCARECRSGAIHMEPDQK